MDSLTGPAMSDAIGTKQKKKLLAFIRDILIAKAEELRVSEISIALQMMTPSLRGENCPRTNPLLEMGCTNALTQTWIVDLRKGREDVWSRMEGRARTEIRNAEKAGLTIRIADRDGDMDIYYRMHLDTYKRTGADALPKEYFESIWKDFAQNGLVRWYFAELDGAPIASENFGIYKNGAIYWSGAADEKALKLGANSLIQWTAMQWMIDNGVEWYETGEAFPNAVSGKLKGLNDFKKSFGGELYPYYRGRIDVSGRIAKVLSFLKNNK